jgi:hypothetical protein
MPYGHYPDGLPVDSVKEAIRRDYHLPIGELRELRYHSAGFRKFLQSAQYTLGSLSNSPRGPRVICPDI